MRNMLQFELRKVHLSFIFPHFNCCADSWHFCSKLTLSTTKLEKVNERAIRFVFMEKSLSYRDLLKTLNRPSLAEQRTNNIAASIFRTINGPSPACLRDVIKLRNSSYNLRGYDILNLPKVNTTKYDLQSWRYYGTKLWNSLPNSLRSLASYKAFRTALSDVDVNCHVLTYFNNFLLSFLFVKFLYIYFYLYRYIIA